MENCTITAELIEDTDFYVHNQKRVERCYLEVYARYALVIVNLM